MTDRLNTAAGDPGPKRPPGAAALIPVLILPLLALGWVRDSHGLVHAFDTGLYLQWLHGFGTTGNLASSVTGEANFLAHHFQPSMLLFAPLITLIGRPAVLFGLAALAAAVTCLLIRRQAAAGGGRWGWLTVAVGAGLIGHPAVATRIFHGFAPDVLALPAFFWMGTRLAGRERGTLWQWLVACLWAGCAKETFWLTNAAALLAASLPSAGAGGRRPGLAALALANFAVFLGLFFWWMPAHTNMPAYYGLRYYLEVTPETPPGLTALVLAAVSNLVSARTVLTLGWLLLLTAGLPLLAERGNRLRLWGAALPGLALILAAREPLVHHPGNHYLIPVLPFLAALALGPGPRATAWAARWATVSRLGPPLLVAPPLLLTLFMSGGAVDAVATILGNPRTRFFREDVEELKSGVVGPADRLVVDGVLQPLFYDFPDVTVLLGFTGNPRRLDLDRTTGRLVVVTTEDLLGIPDCAGIRVGGTQMAVDAAYFSRLCSLVQTRGSEKAVRERSGIRVYEVIL